MKSIVLTFFVFLSLASQKIYSEDSSKVMDQVMQDYEELHAAFFSNKMSSIKKEASDLLDSMKRLENEEVLKKLKFTKEKLESLKSTSELKDARESFDVISQALSYVLKKHYPSKTYERYYCPMVQKYWIQNVSKSEEVKNPYASDTMPYCGSQKKL